MSSSGLIYAVIVGAWAAYLVPMWLRRQDELNEARPTERFSTAIRLLSGRAAMERKISRQLEETQPLAVPSPSTGSPSDSGFADAQVDADAEADRDPVLDEDGNRDAGADDFFVPSAPSVAHSARPAASAASATSAAVASRRRAALLARRRRMVVILFLAFTAGMVGAAVGGVGLLWIPAIPAVLFSLYIAQMRRQEHRRYEIKLDHRRAVEAAQRVRQQAAERREAATAAMAATEAARAPRAPRGARPGAEADGPRQARGADGGGHVPAPTTSGSGTLSEGSVAGAAGGTGATGQSGPASAARYTRASGTPRVPGAEKGEPWADHDAPERGGAASSPAGRRDDGWEPVPVPLPTYVTAPVAPRATLGLDLSAPDTYSSARGRQPGQIPQTPPQAPAATPPRRPAPKPTTPLFDQYADDTPRAANE